MTRPLCFVLMPFGRKADTAGRQIDFDAGYTELIAPSIEAAGLAPLRADEEMTGGIIHKPMYERLILCEYAVADLTTANANVFYELGLRHAVRPASTMLLFAAGSGQLPFDVALLRAIPYALGSDGHTAGGGSYARYAYRPLARRTPGIPDSPLYQLVEDFPTSKGQDDVFRERVHYAEALKASLARARKDGLDAVRAIEERLNPSADAESGVVIDLFLSYRAVKGWTEMIALADKMAPPLAETVLVQEQLGLGRAGHSCAH